jgi:indole-3-glycerol phosphate synthase
MLNKIIENKRKEIEISKRNMPLNSFIYRLKNAKRDFRKAISKNKNGKLVLKNVGPCRANK